MKFQLWTPVVIIASVILACGRPTHKARTQNSLNADNAAAKAQLGTPPPENYEDVGQYYRVRSSSPSSNDHSRRIHTDRGEITLEKGKLQFSQVVSEFRDGKLELSGRMHFSQNRFEDFKMSGKLEHGIIDLTVADPKSPLKDRLKARATCYSIENPTSKSCESYFVDFYYLYKNFVYTEQLIPKTDPLIPRGPGPQPVEPETSQSHDDIPTLEPDEVIENENGIPDVDAESSDQPGRFSGQAERDIFELFRDYRPAPPTMPPPGVNQPPQGNQPKPPQGPGQRPPPQDPKLPLPAPTPPPARPGEKPPEVPSNPRPPVNTPPTKPPVAPGERPRDQAIGLPYRGSLRGASSLLSLYEQRGGASSGFVILRPHLKRYFGTWDLVSFIGQITDWVKAQVPGQMLVVGDLSKETGGTIYSKDPQGRVVAAHSSHKNGLDADIGFFTLPVKEQFVNVVDRKKGTVTPDFQIDHQWKLFKSIHSTGQMDMILVDRVVKQALCQWAVKTGELDFKKDPKSPAARLLSNIISDPGRDHANHFHLRLKCGAFQRACLQGEPAKERPLGCKGMDEKL